MSTIAITALREIGPVGYRHINFGGTCRFPVGIWRQQVLPDESKKAVTRGAASRRVGLDKPKFTHRSGCAAASPSPASVS
jgi:hypothetical protein